MNEMRQSTIVGMNERDSDRTHTEAVRTIGQSVSKPCLEDMRVGKPESHASQRL